MQFCTKIGLQIWMGTWTFFFSFHNQNICCGSQWDGSFEQPKHMFKLMGLKINTILRLKYFLNWSYAKISWAGPYSILGLLLRQMTSDPHLSMYNVIVIDEVHERHIHTDFLLGILKCLVVHRDDIKIVLMSATINIHLFSGYFDDAPVVKVPGRLYPIELEYCPIQRDYASSSKAERLDPSPYLRIMQRIEKKVSRI